MMVKPIYRYTLSIPHNAGRGGVLLYSASAIIAQARMIPQNAIAAAVKRIVVAAHPSSVILFGSRATGKAAADSDLDFLVIESEVPSKVREMARLRQAVGDVGVGVDILVCTKKEAAEWGRLPGTTLYWALKEGKVLYEAPH